jgi:rhamnogalacturonan endolyase
MRAACLIALALSIGAASADAVQGPFLSQLDTQTWLIGNEVWNVTQGPKYATKLYYRGRDCVGNAVGHYVGYSEESLL